MYAKHNYTNPVCGTGGVVKHQLRTERRGGLNWQVMCDGSLLCFITASSLLFFFYSVGAVSQRERNRGGRACMQHHTHTHRISLNWNLSLPLCTHTSIHQTLIHCKALENLQLVKIRRVHRDIHKYSLHFWGQKYWAWSVELVKLSTV